MNLLYLKVYNDLIRWNFQNMILLVVFLSLGLSVPVRDADPALR